LDNNSPGQAEAFSYTATASKTSSKAYVYIDANNQASQVVVGIYGDSNGAPGTLLGQATLNNPHNGAWNNVSLAVPITQGQKYWIAILGPQSTGSVWFRDSATNSSATQSTTSQGTNLNTLPQTWTSGSSWGTSDMSAYLQ
jgi:hypothetical protein